MTFEEMLAYCLSKPGAWQDTPWEDNVVAKVENKIFAYFGDEADPAVTLKCEPLEAEFFRNQYPSIQPPQAYLRKDAYNVIQLDGSIPDDLIQQMIDTSYKLVYQKLTKAQKAAIENESK